MDISVVIPVYKTGSMVDELTRRLTAELGKISAHYEIILVNDGSPDDAWQKITENAVKDSRIKGVLLSRNFGQHHAITAGLDRAEGHWIVVMDGDLQDLPEEIHRLYAEALKGYDLVFARRHNRADTWIKILGNRLFYMVFSYLSGVKQDSRIANFGIYSHKVIAAINSIREPMRAFSPMARWVGFSRSYVDVKHGERLEGKSAYNFTRLFNLSLDIAFSYSEKPLWLVIKMGVLVSFFSLLFVFYCLVAYYSGKWKVPGYASIIASIWLTAGLVIFILGIIGTYVGKSFEGIKNRPLYIIDKEINITDNGEKMQQS